MEELSFNFASKKSLDSVGSHLPKSLCGSWYHLVFGTTWSFSNFASNCRVETRASISDLRSPSLLKKSLPEAMQETLPAAADGSEFRFIVDGTPRQLPATTTNHILRIAREAVINARRHAKPTRIEVCLHYEPDEIRLEINDDGTGFDPKQRPPAGHFGLTGMRERTNKISAEFTIESSSSTGTKVQLRLPSSSPANQSTNN